MTRAEQERLVGNYLRGEMSAAQEQEFFIQVALDSDLRQTLKAFRVVDTAIQKHREAIAPNHAESYNRLMAMLGASATEPAALVGTTSGLLQQGFGFLGARFFSWTTAIVATGALTVGAFIVGPAVYQSDKEINAPQVEAAANQESTPATLDAAISTPEEEGNLQRIAQQPAEAITTGASRQEINDLSAANLNTIKKKELSLNPAAIAAEAREKKPTHNRKEEAATSVQDPFAAMLQDIASQKPATTPTSPKGGVRMVYNWPDNSTQDTINLHVQFDGNGIKKKDDHDK